MELLGKTLGIKKELVQTEFAGKPIDFIQYSMDYGDPLFMEIQAAYPKFRILYPGKMHTQDHRPDRFNVRVDETGLIVETFNG